MIPVIAPPDRPLEFVKNLILFYSDVEPIGSIIFSQIFILKIKEVTKPELELPLDKWRTYTGA